MIEKVESLLLEDLASMDRNLLNTIMCVRCAEFFLKLNSGASPLNFNPSSLSESCQNTCVCSNIEGPGANRAVLIQFVKDKKLEHQHQYVGFSCSF